MQTTLPTGFATLPLNNICSLLQANSLMFMVTYISLDLIRVHSSFCLIFSHTQAAQLLRGLTSGLVRSNEETQSDEHQEELLLHGVKGSVG